MNGDDMLLIDTSDTGKYRLVTGYGWHNELRYEVQEKYSYYDNGNKVESWRLICWSSDRLKAKEMFMRYKNCENNNKRKNSIPINWMD